MDPIRYRGFGAVAIVAAATLATGCGATYRSVYSTGSRTRVPAISTPVRSAPIRSAAATSSRGARDGSGHGPSARPAGLPAGWPPDLPIPLGSVIGSTGSAGRWTVLIVATGSAAEVRQSTVAFYRAAGFTAVSDSVLNKGNRQITLVVENRDHSATETDLVISVATR